MQFIKRDNICKVIRITGNIDNILGVCFSENDDNENNIAVIKNFFLTVLCIIENIE